MEAIGWIDFNALRLNYSNSLISPDVKQWKLVNLLIKHVVLPHPAQQKTNHRILQAVCNNEQRSSWVEATCRVFAEGGDATERFVALARALRIPVNAVDAD